MKTIELLTLPSDQKDAKSGSRCIPSEAARSTATGVKILTLLRTLNGCLQNKVCVGVCYLARQAIEKRRKEALARRRQLGLPADDLSSGSGGYLGSGGYSGSGGDLEY